MRALVSIADFGGRATLPKVKACFADNAFTVVTFSTKSGEYLFDESIGEDLPFAHRQLFANEVDNYDYFFFTENDIFYPESSLKHLFHNFDQFGERRPLGFLRYEEDQLIDFAATPKGTVIVTRDSESFVPTNVHQASYIVSQAQLRIAIDSGNYLISPCRKHGYGKLETGASSVYMDCGLTKAYPVKNLESLSAKHLDLKWKPRQHKYTLPMLNEEIRLFPEQKQG
jgi:hypothetical protein